jgi:hypothetical protein
MVSTCWFLAHNGLSLLDLTGPQCALFAMVFVLGYPFLLLQGERHLRRGVVTLTRV